MGEVYRATDTNLKRQVAIKVLPESLAADSDRLARFQREAEVLAALNHPNIAHIHGLERSEGTIALVMELVEGPTLADRIARGPIPIADALPIARQIAEALEAAHEQGIVHRDLKPANIKVRDDGTVKVLDFGLAKALDPPGGASANAMNSPTLTAATVHGVILGTAAYMAPEQARGKPVDRRADIWAFGVVLFEMLSGTRAFEAEDISATLAFIITKEPDWTVLPATTPAPIRTLLRRCLEKDPRRRLQAIGDARLEIEDSLSGRDDREQPPSASRLLRSERTVWVAAALFTALVGAALAYSLRAPAAPATPVRFEIPIGVTETPNGFAISPDGHQIAYTASGPGSAAPVIWIRDLNSIQSRALPGTEGATQMFWSPDGRTLGFNASGSRLLKVTVDGGRPQLVEAGAGGGRCAWASGDTLLCTGNGRTIRVVSASDGSARPLLSLDSDESVQAWPSMLPDGDHFIYLSWHRATANGTIRVASISDRRARDLLRADSMAVYSRGHLLFMRDTRLLAQRFDVARLLVSGDPLPVADNVLLNRTNGRAAFDASPQGTIVYRSGLDDSTWRLAWVSRAGERLAASPTPGLFVGPTLSPDGARVAFHRIDGNGGDIWVGASDLANVSRLTFDASQENASPVWSPDGKRLAFRSRRGNQWALYEKLANGVGAESLLIESPLVKSPMSWSPDGNVLLFMATDPKTGWDVWSLSLSDHKAAPLLQGPYNEGHPQWSPDGRWFAYISNESGSNQVYVQSFPPGRGKWQVSTTAGMFPLWRRDGRELFFVDGDQVRATVLAVDVKPNNSGLEFSAPHSLFETPFVGGPLPGYSGNYLPWAVAPNGQRFLIPQRDSAAGGTRSAPLIVAMNALEGRER
jgi:Tol biopolymer transport system component